MKGTALLRDLQQYWILRNHSKRELIEAGRDIARLNAHYALKENEHLRLEYEVSRLEALFRLSSLPDYRYEIARVLQRDIHTWWQQMLIDKGRNENIPKAGGVVFSGGVVGRIREVYTSTSIVELVSSPDFRIAAHFERDARPFTYQGRLHLPFTAPVGQVCHIPLDLNTGVETSQRLVTSRLGGVFPTGLLIGTVHSLRPADNGLFLNGTVQLDKRLLSLKEVAVLISLRE